MTANGYRTLADVVLALHVAFVVFVVVGLLLVWLGGWLGWQWTRNPWFRAAHLAAIGLVIVQAWFDIVCPLTTLEMSLRERAGDPAYGGTFIAHWLQRLLYFEAPEWVFVVVYTLFGIAVAVSWVKFRPFPFRRKASKA